MNQIYHILYNHDFQKLKNRWLLTNKQIKISYISKLSLAHKKSNLNQNHWRIHEIKNLIFNRCLWKYVSLKRSWSNIRQVGNQGKRNKRKLHTNLRLWLKLNGLLSQTFLWPDVVPIMSLKASSQQNMHKVFAKMSHIQTQVQQKFSFKALFTKLTH